MGGSTGKQLERGDHVRTSHGTEGIVISVNKTGTVNIKVKPGVVVSDSIYAVVKLEPR